MPTCVIDGCPFEAINFAVGGLAQASSYALDNVREIVGKCRPTEDGTGFEMIYPDFCRGHVWEFFITPRLDEYRAKLQELSLVDNQIRDLLEVVRPDTSFQGLWKCECGFYTRSYLVYAQHEQEHRDGTIGMDTHLAHKPPREHRERAPRPSGPREPMRFDVDDIG